MDGYVVIGTQLDTKSFEAQIDYIEGQLQEIEHKLKQADMGFEVGDTQKLEAQYEKLVNQLENLKKKQADINKADLTNIQKSIDKVGDSTSNVIKKVGKWALAVFGIRSAYMFVRNAMSTLSQYNEQIKSDTEYISYALASMLQPVIERLIQLAYTLLNYVNYIAQAWFGVDLFANASADAMRRASQSAEKMKKSLAGFDEMNVLNDNGTTGAMGGLPSYDLSAPEDIEIPSWLQWIADNKDIVIAGLAGIAGGLLSIKLGLDLIGGTSVFLILTGAILLIQQLIEYFGQLDTSLENNGTSWDGLGKIIASVGIILAGIALAIASVPVAIAAAIVSILALLGTAWESIMGLWAKGSNWINDRMNWLSERGSIVLTSILAFVHDTIGGAIEIFNGLFKGVKQVVDGILLLFKKGEFKNGIVNIFKGIVNIVIGILNGLISGLNAFISPIRALVVAVGKVTGKNWTMDNIKIPKVPYLARGGIVNNPGRGVYMGGYVAGENGPEAVLPLTDDTLQRLASMIPITVNLTNTMNGRVISRELQKVNSSSDFAFNR